MEDRKFSFKRGNPSTLGVTRDGGGYNFAVAVPPNESEVSLLVYKKGDSEPAKEIPLRDMYRTGSVYAVHVLGFDPACHEYNYRMGKRIVQDPCAVVLRGDRKSVV